MAEERMADGWTIEDGVTGEEDGNDRIVDK